jgi:hypothetical protein
MRENWLSNRIFKSFDDVVDHCCCGAWNKLVDQPWRIMSIGLREFSSWARAGAADRVIVLSFIRPKRRWGNFLSALVAEDFAYEMRGVFRGPFTKKMGSVELYGAWAEVEGASDLLAG